MRHSSNRRYLNRRSLTALATTSAEAPVSANTAIHSVATPDIASARNATFSPIDSADVDADVGERRAAEANGVAQLRQVVGHQRDVSRLERHGAAHRAHGNADVGSGQRRARRSRRRRPSRRRPNSRRSDCTAATLSWGSCCDFTIVDVQLARHGAGGRVVVARDHRDARALCRGGGRQESARHPAFGRSRSPNTPIAAPSRETSTGDSPRVVIARPRCRPAAASSTRAPSNSRGVPHRMTAPATVPSTPRPGSALHIGRHVDRRTGGRGVRHDCRRDRMLRLRFHRGRQPNQLVGRNRQRTESRRSMLNVPVVSVPVLSNATTRTPARRSR